MVVKQDNGTTEHLEPGKCWVGLGGRRAWNRLARARRMTSASQASKVCVGVAQQPAPWGAWSGACRCNICAASMRALLGQQTHSGASREPWHRLRTARHARARPNHEGQGSLLRPVALEARLVAEERPVDIQVLALGANHRRGLPAARRAASRCCSQRESSSHGARWGPLADWF